MEAETKMQQGNLIKAKEGLQVEKQLTRALNNFQARPRLSGHWPEAEELKKP